MRTLVMMAALTFPGAAFAQASVQAETGRPPQRIRSVTLAAGEPEVWVRAFDDAGNAQPLDADEGWNPAGYEWGSAERVRLAVF